MVVPDRGRPSAHSVFTQLQIAMILYGMSLEARYLAERTLGK